MLPQEELKSVELCPSVAISAVVFRSSALQVPAAASSAGEINPTVEGDGQASSSQSTLFRKLPFPYGLVYCVKTHHHTTGDNRRRGCLYRCHFLQEPPSRRGWTQITGLRTTAWWGWAWGWGERGSSCTTLRSRGWEKKPKQTWVRRAWTLICQVFTSAVHSR